MAPAAADAAGFPERPNPSSDRTPKWVSSKGMAWSGANTQSSSGVVAQEDLPLKVGLTLALALALVLGVTMPKGRSGFSNSGAELAYSSSLGRSCCNSSWIRSAALSPENSVARNSPVERSRAAKPARSPDLAPSLHDDRTTAARKLFSSELRDESAAVPGVTTRVTSRLTNFLANRGSSTCSQMATL